MEKKRASSKERNINKFLIIGYGKFGEAFARKLLEEGVKENKIFIIDRLNEFAMKAATTFTNVYVANVDDFDRLNVIDINSVGIIIIAMANIEESLMIAANRKKYSEKIFYAKAKNDLHKKLLKILGVDEVVIPEQEIGTKLAYKCLFKNDVEINDINTNYNIINFNITNSKFATQTISSLKLREKFNCNIFGIKRNNHFFIPDANETIMKNDTLSVVCQKDDSKNFLDFFTQ
ncbi:MAG: TrkA family potassium uptake protein [Malacoplasma sp.]